MEDEDTGVLRAIVKEAVSEAHEPPAPGQTPFQIFKGSFARAFGLVIGAIGGLLVLGLAFGLVAETLGLFELIFGM